MFCFVAIKLDQSLDDNQNCSLARNGLVWMIIKKKRYPGDYHIFLYESRGILQNAECRTRMTLKFSAEWIKF